MVALGFGAVRAQTPLPPLEQAFRLRVRRSGLWALDLQWIAAPGTQLYRDRFAVRADDPQVALADVECPPARTRYDALLGEDVAFYEGTVLLHVRYAGPAIAFHLLASAQGCAPAAGVCYPPVIYKVPVRPITP